ncbi:putative toxin-antitoxin system antitoxin component (TIGR02293 family) [Pseudomonas migulae]|uniref:antitoxin Xre/MbcA/ParS toxin-binding domain-containing protein n=1 Tax=Pseudomonas migulae TaxID=78543 RepID=UPI0020A1556A|nr:antitoxin Xre/MbcA/ParS toxin-binding domain-containing protein [Pseudomonas migulae]MCP1496186.1 putative toxin-antitoxin system antitoxin component (TIGR02293 family) [Pseudomonas migulae]
MKENQREWHSMRHYQPDQASPAPTPWDSLGIPVSGPELITQLHQGFSIKTLQALSQLIEIDTQTLGKAISLSNTTLIRRFRAGRFNTVESDSIFRLATIILAALELFEGDGLSAKAWLQARQIGLGGRKPLDLVSTQVEANSILRLIGQIEHGVPS